MQITSSSRSSRSSSGQWVEVEPRTGLNEPDDEGKHARGLGLDGAPKLMSRYLGSISPFSRSLPATKPPVPAAEELIELMKKEKRLPELRCNLMPNVKENLQEILKARNEATELLLKGSITEGQYKERLELLAHLFLMAMGLADEHGLTEKVKAQCKDAGIRYSAPSNYTNWIQQSPAIGKAAAVLGLELAAYFAPHVSALKTAKHVVNWVWFGTQLWASAVAPGISGTAQSTSVAEQNQCLPELFPKIDPTKYVPLEGKPETLRSPSDIQGEIDEIERVRQTLHGTDDERNELHGELGKSLDRLDRSLEKFLGNAYGDVESVYDKGRGYLESDEAKFESIYRAAHDRKNEGKFVSPSLAAQTEALLAIKEGPVALDANLSLKVRQLLKRAALLRNLMDDLKSGRDEHTSVELGKAHHTHVVSQEYEAIYFFISSGHAKAVRSFINGAIAVNGIGSSAYSLYSGVEKLLEEGAEVFPTANDTMLNATSPGPMTYPVPISAGPTPLPVPASIPGPEPIPVPNALSIPAINAIPVPASNQSPMLLPQPGPEPIPMPLPAGGTASVAGPQVAFPLAPVMLDAINLVATIAQPLIYSSMVGRKTGEDIEKRIPTLMRATLGSGLGNFGKPAPTEDDPKAVEIDMKKLNDLFQGPMAVRLNHFKAGLEFDSKNDIQKMMVKLVDPKEVNDDRAQEYKYLVPTFIKIAPHRDLTGTLGKLTLDRVQPFLAELCDKYARGESGFKKTAQALGSNYLSAADTLLKLQSDAAKTKAAEAHKVKFLAAKIEAAKSDAARCMALLAEHLLNAVPPQNDVLISTGKQNVYLPLTFKSLSKYFKTLITPEEREHFIRNLANTRAPENVDNILKVLKHYEENELNIKAAAAGPEGLNELLADDSTLSATSKTLLLESLAYAADPQTFKLFESSDRRLALTKGLAESRSNKGNEKQNLQKYGQNYASLYGGPGSPLPVKAVIGAAMDALSYFTGARFDLSEAALNALVNVAATVGAWKSFVVGYYTHHYVFVKSVQRGRDELSGSQAMVNSSMMSMSDRTNYVPFVSMDWLRDKVTNFDPLLAEKGDDKWLEGAELNFESDTPVSSDLWDQLFASGAGWTVEYEEFERRHGKLAGMTEEQLLTAIRRDLEEIAADVEAAAEHSGDPTNDLQPDTVIPMRSPRDADHPSTKSNAPKALSSASKAANMDRVLAEQISDLADTLFTPRMKDKTEKVDDRRFGDHTIEFNTAPSSNLGEAAQALIDAVTAYEKSGGEEELPVMEAMNVLTIANPEQIVSAVESLKAMRGGARFIVPLLKRWEPQTDDQIEWMNDILKELRGG